MEPTAEEVHPIHDTGAQEYYDLCNEIAQIKENYFRKKGPCILKAVMKVSRFCMKRDLPEEL